MLGSWKKSFAGPVGCLVWYCALLTLEDLDLIALSWFSPRFYGKHVVSWERSCLLFPRFPGHAGSPPAAAHRHHRLCEHVGRVLGQPHLHGEGLQVGDGLRRQGPDPGPRLQALSFPTRGPQPLASHQVEKRWSLSWGQAFAFAATTRIQAAGILGNSGIFHTFSRVVL